MLAVTIPAETKEQSPTVYTVETVRSGRRHQVPDSGTQALLLERELLLWAQNFSKKHITP